MSSLDDDFLVRLGRIRSRGTKGGRAKSFVGQVLKAADKGAGRARATRTRSKGGGASRFGRGAIIAARRGRHPSDRRVLVKMRIVRHKGMKYTAAPMARHLAYLEREGVSRDGQSARMFGAIGDGADGDAFSERCKDDRHHFRFIVSPEDAAELQDLRSFTRELMQDAERDLGTSLDWVAVDHWNTDNPHVHILVRGRADDSRDLVIRRDYIRQGFRERAEERVMIELGPRSKREIEAALRRDVDANRWTGLDRSLVELADRCGGVADLRPDPGGGSRENRNLLIGRAQKLEALGLAQSVEPAVWTLKSDLQQSLRDLGVRGDIIKAMHQAMGKGKLQYDTSRFAIHALQPTDPVIGRLVGRGLYDELEGSAYAIVDGVDGRTHHLRFDNIDVTGDAKAGAIVELRSWEDSKGRNHLSLGTRSDMTLAQQITADGATWLDHNLVSREPQILGGGFGAEVAAAMQDRCDHLEGEGLVQRQGRRLIFARSLLSTLKEREMERVTLAIAARTRLTPQPTILGQTVAGIYREKVTLASGRFAMIDNGLGFQLVPWRPALEQKLGQHVSGTITPNGGVDWNIGKNRGIGM
jgi:type IV secretory pathway VirD2 relaxase